MAVVFISPRQRQKMFITGITVMFALGIIVISFLVFLSKPKDIPVELVFNRPKINIDFTVLDSDQFKNLIPFTEMQTMFDYTAITKEGDTKNGIVSAVSIEEAQQILKEMGLTVREIKEAEIGRKNPFEPYY